MIVVTGATGNVGRDLVADLLARGQDVRALTRTPEAAGLPDTVETVRGDPSDERALAAALDGADAVFLNVFGDPGPVVRALDGSTVRRVGLLSTQSAGSRPDLVEAGRYRDLEARVRAVRDDTVVLRPGQFMSNTLWWGPMIARGHVAAPFADVAVPVIDPADVAAVAAEALLDDRHRGAAHLLIGPEAPTPRERVGVIADVLGRPLGFDEISAQQFRDASPGVPPDALDYMIAMLGHPTDEDRRTGDAVVGITGRPARSFRDWVARHRSALLAGSR